jgi:hypothetical protein
MGCRFDLAAASASPTHPPATSSTAPTTTTTRHAAHRVVRALAFGVADGLVDAEHQARRLRGGRDGVHLPKPPHGARGFQREAWESRAEPAEKTTLTHLDE